MGGGAGGRGSCRWVHLAAVHAKREYGMSVCWPDRTWTQLDSSWVLRQVQVCWQFVCFVSASASFEPPERSLPKFTKRAARHSLSLSLSYTYCLQLDFIRLHNLCSLANAGNKQWQQHSGNYLAKSAVNATWADSDLQHTLLFLTHSLTHWLPLVQFPFQFQFQLLVSGLLCVLRSQWGI